MKKPNYIDFLNDNHYYGDDAFTVISTFAGMGGSSEGYKMAGGKVLAAIDFDKNAAENYQYNHHGTLFLLQDIKTITAEELLNVAGLDIGDLDILDGSPPCQGFSTAGKRLLNDPRNQLYHEFVRLIDGLKPKVIVMENVSGMVKGNMKKLFYEILRDLNKHGYNIKAKLLNAANYGVPQKRQRIIFIGVRKDLKFEPIFPQPLSYHYVVKEAFEGLPKDTHEEGSELFRKLWPLVGWGESFSKVHPKRYWFNEIKVHPYKPSPTITKTVMKNGGAGLVHWKYIRHLNIDELKRIQSIPDRFKLIGTFEQKWARIGNSVPPLMMKAIARTIYEKILKNI